MDADLDVLGAAADRLQQPAFQWYTVIYRLVRALLEGRFDAADTLAATAVTAARHAPEFSVGLYFAEAVTDLRDLDHAGRCLRASRLDEMAGRFPGVLVWRCLAMLNELARSDSRPRGLTWRAFPPPAREPGIALGASARVLATQVLAQEPRDAHWLVECCLLSEIAAELGDLEMAGPLDEALRPYAGRLAVAGRVAAFRGSVSYELGLLALTGGRVEQAVEDLDAAVAQHQRIGAVPCLVRSLLALGRALDARDRGGDRTRAASARRHAAARGASLVPR